MISVRIVSGTLPFGNVQAWNGAGESGAFERRYLGCCARQNNASDEARGSILQRQSAPVQMADGCDNS
jgi:hypothetical protein